ncbi:hypothetical protein GCM10023081_15430 [Arthrobacter ginkgonis]|uniref:Uncharacterized protein n=1 Tax=Arthrobacter ginkgonis TaxID=1630594 RepID=A0ABP7C2Y2_9MICC
MRVRRGMMGGRIPSASSTAHCGIRPVPDFRTLWGANGIDGMGLPGWFGKVFPKWSGSKWSGLCSGMFPQCAVHGGRPLAGSDRIADGNWPREGGWGNDGCG